MNFSIYTGLNKKFAELGIEGCADYLSGMGFSSIELFSMNRADYTPSVADIPTAKAVRAAMEARGLTVSCFSVAASLYRCEEDVDFLKRQVELAATVGSPLLHHTLYPTLGLRGKLPFPFEEVLPAVLESADRVASVAESFGLTCIYEPQGYYFNGIEPFGAFYREMKRLHPAIGVCGDLGNSLFVGASPADFLRAFAGEVRHVHVKDYARRNGEEIRDGASGFFADEETFLEEVPIGEGDAEIPACLGLLKAVGYRGAFALEFAFPDFDGGAREAMRRLNEWYQ